MKENRRCSALLTSVLGLVLVAGLIRPQEIVAGTNTFDEKSIKQWTLKGPLTERLRQVSEVLPLSDQQNKGRWVRFEPMWDEFSGPTLDKNKWTVECGLAPALSQESRFAGQRRGTGQATASLAGAVAG